MVKLNRSDSKTRNFRVRGTAYANLTPVKGLTITSRFGYQGGFGHTSSYNPDIYMTAKNNQSFSISGNYNDRIYYQWENFANYNTTIAKKHTISAMAGMSYQQTNTDNLRASANQLSNYDPNFRYLNNAVNTTQMSIGGQPNVSANKFIGDCSLIGQKR